MSSSAANVLSPNNIPSQLKDVSEIVYEYKSGKGSSGPGSFYKLLDSETVVFRSPYLDTYITIKYVNIKLNTNNGKTTVYIKGEDIINMESKMAVVTEKASSDSMFSQQTILILLVILIAFIVIIRKYVMKGGDSYDPSYMATTVNY